MCSIQEFLMFKSFFTSLLLPPFQIVSRSGFSRYIAFTMYLDIIKAMYLEKPERLTIWNGGSTC